MSAGRIVVFSGPTLSEEEGRREVPELSPVTWLPPVAQGDLYLAAREGPWGLGIVDGYFDRLASVWHKEILWALEQGIHVFGAASLGALRAVECEPFGMRGVGEIYRSFQAGELSDDDEVTVFHGPGSTGYAKGSEAMVNLRATFAAAGAAGVIGETTRSELIVLAKALRYPERGLPLILERARRADLSATELNALEAWLPGGRIDQKKLDALAMLRRMVETRAEHPGPFVATFTFQRTEAWESGRVAAEARAATAAGEEAAVDPLDELRLGAFAEANGESPPAAESRYAQARAAALTRVLGLVLADYGGLHLDAPARERAVDRFRQRRGLADDDALAAFLFEQRLDVPGLTRIAVDEARIERALARIEPLIEGALRDDLRLRDAYAPLAARAEAKTAALAAKGLSRPELRDTGLSLDELWRWYFEARLGRPVPDGPDALERAARELGFGGLDEMRRALVREALFVRN